MGNETFYWDGLITFLYRTLAKVNALARADITSIHSQREIKEIFDLETHPFIN